MVFPRAVNDRVVEFPRRYQLTLVPGTTDTYDLVPVPGVVTEEGTPINKNHLQLIENALADVSIPVDNTPELIYDGDVLVAVEEKIAGVLRRQTQLNYTTGTLTSVRVRVYADDGVTVTRDFTDTLQYTDGKLKFVPRTVSL